MSDGIKVSYDEALDWATRIRNYLEKHFDRLEIGGSIRRKKAQIGDIELVGIIKPTIETDLFDWNKEISSIESVPQWMDLLHYKPKKMGTKYMQFTAYYNLNVDLFLCTPETWGCIFTIRTGSSDFTRRLVTKKSKGGLCPDNMQFSDGRLWRDNIVLDTPEESDVFRELGIEFISPEERIK